MDDLGGNADRGGLDPSGSLWKRVLLVLGGVLGLALLLGVAASAVQDVARMVIESRPGDPPQEIRTCSSQGTADPGRGQNGAQGKSGEACPAQAAPGGEGAQARKPTRGAANE